ncbi:MAG: bifunctional diguanylate cyclase/phosphodiesterase [Pseudomonadota bacterium]
MLVRKNIHRLFPILEGLSSNDWHRITDGEPISVQKVWIKDKFGRYAGFDLHVGPILNRNSKTETFFVFAAPQDRDTNTHRTLLQNAYQDPLTGLYNRRFFELTANDFVATCTLDQDTFGLLLIDVDNFKTINDQFGHTVGDQALCQIAQAVTDAVPLGETIARFGGDEFIVLLHDAKSVEDLEATVNEIRREVARPLVIGQNTIQLEVSIGSSLYPFHGQSLDRLIERADESMFEAKRQTKSGSVGSAPSFSTARKSEEWVHLFLDSLQNGQMQPHMQPIVDLRTGAWIGAEVLSRWTKPDGGIATPHDFISLAESNNVTPHLDTFIFATTCKSLAAHAADFPPNFEMSVNVSAQSLREPGFVETLQNALRENDIAPRKICVELTESDALSEHGLGRTNLKKLNEIGLKIALDDFGTGYSSLSLLQDLPISRIKIDKSFLTDICTSGRKQGIVESVLMLCRSLPAESVAEGIETREQSNLLTGMGSTYGQGFHFGRPAPLPLFLSDMALQA